ncbi:MAG: DUF1194 domain-containing protein [Rhizobiales bacterium]|nr:DUF1194 domain-containing protein [Hyphomicrobiales bacterium]
MRLSQQLLGLLAAVLFCISPTRAGENGVDLKLVLAVDASGSVDQEEFALQLGGIAAAFRDPAVREAIRSGPKKRIAVNITVWAQHEVPKDSTGWSILTSDADIERFAAMAEALPRRVNGGTGMGAGLAAALRELETSGLEAPREIVDISGDGAESPARDYVVMMPQARQMARSRGVVVNGLAILGEANVEEWYRRNVLVGPGSFLVVARDYEDFAEAMRRKLLREITHDARLSGLQ